MLNRRTFFIREHVGLLKLTDTFDILDPETQTQLGIARERPGALIETLRLVVDKRMLPTKVFVYEGTDAKDESRLVFSLHRGISFFTSKIEIRDNAGGLIGWFQSKLFSMGGAFRVFDAAGTEVAGVKGDWKGWNFKFLDNAGNELGSVTKKWSGLGRELFTSADNYIIALTQDSAPALAILLLAAGLAVDTVYKER